MKVELSEIKQQFRPVHIVLETKEEFDFLYGLLGIGKSTPKEEAHNFSEDLDQMMWDKLDEVA